MKNMLCKLKKKRCKYCGFVFILIFIKICYIIFIFFYGNLYGVIYCYYDVMVIIILSIYV